MKIHAGIVVPVLCMGAIIGLAIGIQIEKYNQSIKPPIEVDEATNETAGGGRILKVAQDGWDWDPWKPPLVIIEWDDASTGEDVWSHKDDFERPYTLCFSVGFILEETDRFITVAQTVGDDGFYNHSITIPKPFVNSSEVFKVNPK